MNTGIHQTVPSLAETRDLREYLRRDLIRRCKLNPRYSLRAFSRFLKIDSSALSKILAGKRAASPALTKQLCVRLGLDPKQTANFLSTTGETRGRKSLTESPKPSLPKADYKQLTYDLFQVISDWYHYAILELTKLNDFKPTRAWVARSLGITIPEVDEAVERLQRLEFLEITAEGRWIDRSGDVTTVGNDFTAIAFRKYQKQILEKAITALEEVPLENRDHTSMLMAGDSLLLPEAKKLIAEFRRKLCALLESGTQKDELYQLGIALYPLTNQSLRSEKRS
jgi:uncharacterized protein (TIGR02147 family)